MDISDRRTASPFSQALAAFPGKPAVVPGASSYFTAPTTTLDPHLFNAQEGMHSSVRIWLRHTVLAALGAKGFRGADRWLRIWVAGSGASYQWSAARDPGDLDVLLGVDYLAFRQAHMEYQGLSDREISDDINDALQADLWKRTANAEVNGAHYEVTWYVNPGSTDIRNIHPYAAYDVDNNDWTVRPVDLPAAGPGEWFPKEFAEAADRDKDRATEVVQDYNAAVAALQDPPNIPQRINAMASLVAASSAAVALFDEIHRGRHAAFEATGEGYRDYANYRWQRGKLLGTVPAVRVIKDAVKEARKDAEYRLYGQELLGSEKALRQAALGR